MTNNKMIVFHARPAELVSTMTRIVFSFLSSRRRRTKCTSYFFVIRSLGPSRIPSSLYTYVFTAHCRLLGDSSFSLVHRSFVLSLAKSSIVSVFLISSAPRLSRIITSSVVVVVVVGADCHLYLYGYLVYAHTIVSYIQDVYPPPVLGLMPDAM